MEEPNSKDIVNATDRLTEMVLDHLGIPRPGMSKQITEIQDELLHSFMETARQAWMAAGPIPLQPSVPVQSGNPIYQFLSSATLSQPQNIRKLNTILDDLGVHDLLRDVADSPDVAALATIPVDPYEERLLKAVGHPNPSSAVRGFLVAASKESSAIKAPDTKLEEAAAVSIATHQKIIVITNINVQAQTTAPTAGGSTPSVEKPKRRKIFTGLGKMFSGLVLLAGNALVIPTLASTGIGTVAAIPVLGSLAGGIAAVGEGVGSLTREGE